MALSKFRAPALPDPPQEWDKTYMRQFLRVLEIYFSQLDGNSPNYAESYTADYFHGSGVYLTTPYGSFTSDTTQTIGAINVAGTVHYDLQVFGKAAGEVTYDGVSKISVTSDGLYRITYSLQLTNPSTEVNVVQVWIRKNGVDAPDSTRRFGIPQRKNASVLGTLIAEASYLGVINVGDDIEVMWNTPDLSVSITYTPPVAASGTTPAVPGTPAAVVQLAFVSKE